MRLPFTIPGNGANSRQLAPRKTIQARLKVSRKPRRDADHAAKAATAVPQIKQDPVSKPNTNGASPGRQDLEVDTVLAKELHDNGEQILMQDFEVNSSLFLHVARQYIPLQSRMQGVMNFDYAGKGIASGLALLNSSSRIALCKDYHRGSVVKSLCITRVWGEIVCEPQKRGSEPLPLLLRVSHIAERLAFAGFRSTRRTKIICTIGPCTCSSEMLKTLAENGMNVARLNMGHGTHDWHKDVIDKIRKLNRDNG